MRGTDASVCSVEVTRAVNLGDGFHTKASSVQQHAHAVHGSGHRPRGARALEDSAGGATTSPCFGPPAHQPDGLVDPVTELLQLAAQPQSPTALMQLQELLTRQCVLSAVLNAGDRRGRTALHHVMRRGDAPMMQLLAAAEGVDFNVLDDRGCTPLATAVAHGHSRLIAKYLFAASANSLAVSGLDATLHAPGAPEASPMALALTQPHAEPLKSLLHTIKLLDRLQDGMGQRVSPAVLPQPRSAQSHPAPDALQAAAHGGSGMARAAGHRGRTAAGSVCSLAALLRQPCDAQGRPPLLLALLQRRMQHAFLLISYGSRLNVCEPGPPDVTNTSSTSAMHARAVLPGRNPLHIIVQLIIELEEAGRHTCSSGERGGQSSASPPGGGSPTQPAYMDSSPHGLYGGNSSSSAMLSSGAFNSQPPLAQAYSLLHLTAGQPTASQACYLQDAEGNTPLHLAAAAGLGPVVELLLRTASAKSALLHIRNQRGLTAMQAAVAGGHAAVSQLLADTLPRHSPAFTTGQAHVLRAAAAVTTPSCAAQTAARLPPSGRSMGPGSSSISATVGHVGNAAALAPHSSEIQPAWPMDAAGAPQLSSSRPASAATGSSSVALHQHHYHQHPQQQEQHWQQQQQGVKVMGGAQGQRTGEAAGHQAAGSQKGSSWARALKPLTSAFKSLLNDGH